MAVHNVSDQNVQGRLDAGWYLFACALFSALLVSEYRTPLIAIAFAIMMAVSGIVWIRNFPTPHLPRVAYWLVGILILGFGSAVIADAFCITIETTDLQRDIRMTGSYL